jgi:cell division transport system permease protein
MNLITFYRIALAGSRNFLRNAWLSTAATAVMAVTLIIILMSGAVTMAMNATIKGIVNKIDVSLYLKDSVTEEQRKALEDKLMATPNVSAVRYVSKTEALSIYRKQVAGNEKLLAAVTEAENPLPASLQVKTADPKQMDPIVALVEQPENKQLLAAAPSYSGDRKATIDRIVRVSSFLKTAGLLASLLFVIISILIIFNTIRMAIFTRRQEIDIMKLVGATNNFIRGPFIFEACLYGIIASVIAFIITYAILTIGGPAVTKYLDINQTVAFFKEYPVLIAFIQLSLGIFIGATSSLLAMVRYLKL